MAPLVYLVRHGQTEWSKIGRYTGKSEKKLTEAGKKEALALGDNFFGAGKYIDPSRIVCVIASPRVRAQETLQLLTKNDPGIMKKVIVSEEFSEWDHGSYEGLTTEEIRSRRAEKGLDKSSTWSIWTGGCEDGEYEYTPFSFLTNANLGLLFAIFLRSVQDMTRRVNQAITMIENAKRDYMTNEQHGNVMVVGHGTHLRCLWKIWHGLPIDYPVNIKFGTGTVATLSYEDRDNRSVVEEFTDQAEHNIGIRIG
ncbi:phosphoglycerate mutase [Fusarium longipes]|uniref:Phosphoglycerate mutase n=1 Tax=Fusarium longipes TaxID=694270 RepID=A0A395T9P4_9HYPO|nr:phosphoglycerate mutase [Fusarium longipes]